MNNFPSSYYHHDGNHQPLVVVTQHNLFISHPSVIDLHRDTSSYNRTIVPSPTPKYNGFNNNNTSLPTQITVDIIHPPNPHTLLPLPHSPLPQKSPTRTHPTTPNKQCPPSKPRKKVLPPLHPPLTSSWPHLHILPRPVPKNHHFLPPSPPTTSSLSAPQPTLPAPAPSFSASYFQKE